MPRLLIQLVWAIWLASPVLGSVFEDANKLYEQGQYSEAIPLYQNLLESGRQSPGVLFNLGNAYFKSGQLGRAIFHYQLAQRIAPRDPDIQANLRFARDRVSGSNSLQPGPLDRFLRYFTLNELATVSMLLLWLWIGLLCLNRARPALRAALRPYLAACAALFVAVNLFLAAAWRQAAQPVAILIQRQATIHLGPLRESQPAYTATDGTELRVLARREDWLQVEDRSQRTGWLNVRDALVFSALD